MAAHRALPERLAALVAAAVDRPSFADAIVSKASAAGAPASNTSATPPTAANRWLVSVTYANGLFVVTGGTPPASESSSPWMPAAMRG